MFGTIHAFAKHPNKSPIVLSHGIGYDGPIMCDEVGNRPGRKRKPEVTEDQIRGAKYLRNIMDLLKPLHAHKDCHNRQLHYIESCPWELPDRPWT